VRSGQNLLLFPVIAELSLLPLLKFGILLSLISELMVTCLDDRMVNSHNGWVEAENAQGNRNPPLPTLAQAIASILKLLSCGSLWPTLPVVAMEKGMLSLQLRPPIATSRSLIRQSSSRQESLLRMTIGFVQSSQSLGSYAAWRCRRLSSPCSSYGVVPVCGGPTTPPLAPWTTRCRGLSSAVPSAPTTFQQA
jgi:hypothetical protein